MSEYLDRLEGLTKLAISWERSSRYFVQSPIAHLLAEQIIAGLPSDRQLTFFDPFYPSRSDPGAYVSIRQSSGLYGYMLGNHGWSTGWLNQSKELLTKYLDLCLATHSLELNNSLSLSALPEGSHLNVLKR